MTIPAIFAERGASYKDLAILSTLSIPYSLKFLFAPILDSVYLVSLKVVLNKDCLVLL